MMVRNRFLYSLGLIASLSACSAMDRRPGDQQSKDSFIQSVVERRLDENFGQKVHVNATVYNQTLLLTGEVPTAELKTEVDALIKVTPNVKRVIDEIKTAKPSETSARLNDATITTNVKALLGKSGQLEISSSKVVTEANTTYLLGIVTQAEADTMIDITRRAQGVSKVVNLLQIVSDAELAKYKTGELKQ